MFVKSKQDYAAYGSEKMIIKDGLYIVYAIEIREDKTNYFAFPAGYEEKEGLNPDPLFFPADIFEMVEDRISSTWETNTLKLTDEDVTYSSFPEWFENDFYIRGHDWDFEDKDYLIMKKYIIAYREIYADILSSVKPV